MDSLVVDVCIVSFYLLVRENVHICTCVYHCKYCIELDL